MSALPPTLAGLPGTCRARKLPEEVDVRFAREPGSCATLEGEVRYEAGDALIEAAAGDCWVVRREVFRERYEPVAPTQPLQDGRYRKRRAEVFAQRLDAPFRVPLPEGRGELRGRPGDWLVEYGPADFAIVAEDIFDRTYELLPR